MALLRPRVHAGPPRRPGVMSSGSNGGPPEDTYLAKVVKYIPAESIASYQAAVGFAAQDSHALSWFVLLLVVCTPLWVLVATNDRQGWAWYQALVALLAFLVWLIAADSTFIGWALSGFQGEPHHAALTGASRSLILIAATLLFPLVEKLLTKMGVNVYTR